MTSVETTVSLGEDGAGHVRRTVLPSGLRILTEFVPTVRSVAVGMWVGVGSVDEGPAQAGATHYLEHLLFKGTRTRSALDISAAVEAVGGEINAFTAKEFTCYYARVLDSDLPVAVDILADMLSSSVIAAADVDSEREVVLEEIAMRDDDPTDAVHDLVGAKLWGADAPLGRSILGSVESITAMSQDTVAEYYRSQYAPPRVVITAAGNVDHAEVVKLVVEAFAPSGFLAGTAAPAPPRLTGPLPRLGHGVTALERPTEQANLILAVPGLPRTDDRRFALSVLNFAIGGGMSSRLFQEIRENRGLAYSVYSYAANYAAAGHVGVYAGCQPKKAEQVIEVSREVLADVAANGITAEELERGRGQSRGALVLGLEDTGARMSRLAKSELVHDELPSVDELLARIDAVTLDDVNVLAAQLYTGSPVLAVVGPFADPSRLVATLS